MLKSTTVSTTPILHSRKSIYLLLTIVGTIIPWFWLLQDPAALLSPSLFLQKTFVNNIATTWASDLILSAIAFFYFAWIELKRLQVSRSWIILYIGLTFGVGLCCSLPYFLYRREQWLHEKA
ncbi:MAG: DUF2834 domain-containing protein [Oscillatoriophycideae cyanobacterium NC_groundwater_1537_Pr4_S-0.65um_50_18]|nr:DUF2834 domain-containing protein [Oscillatoriophycideae cyanobacterium NC_groundwater_1537_Pr4_S-0.65um_50_18]